MIHIYEVHEQWPHRSIVWFFELEDAISYIKANGNKLNCPIILQHKIEERVK